MRISRLRVAYLEMLRNSEEYKEEMQQWGTGSAIQQGIQAATAVIQGLAGGNIAQAVSGAAAPYLAEQIHYLTTDANGKVNTEANLMAHAVVGVVTAYAAGNSALGAQPVRRWVSLSRSSFTRTSNGKT